MKRIDFYATTDIGKVRLANEDQTRVLINPTNSHVLGVVCDGMGGQNRGDYASKLAVDMLEERFRLGGIYYRLFPSSWFKKAVRDINKTIFELGDKNEEYAKMGTTLAAVILRKNKIYVVNVGDSRVYLSNNGALKQITNDQTYVEFLYKTGQISKNEMETHPKRHILMNAMGSFPTLNIDLNVHEYHGETILICSDGLYNSASENEIWSILETNESAEQKAKLLIDVANQNGGADNIATCIIQEVEVEEND